MTHSASPFTSPNASPTASPAASHSASHTKSPATSPDVPHSASPTARPAASPTKSRSAPDSGAPSKPPQIFSKRRRRAQYLRALQRQSQPDAARFLADEAVSDVIDRLKFMRHDVKTALIIGDFTGALEQYLRDEGAQVVSMAIGELDEEEPIEPVELLKAKNEANPSRDQTPDHDAKFDLIYHQFGLATVNDLPGALIHSRMGLSTGGLLLATVIGAGSLIQLRHIMMAADVGGNEGEGVGARVVARMHPLVDNRAAAALLQRAGFSRQVVDGFALNARYADLSRLIDDLRDQGLCNVLKDAPSPLNKAGWARANAQFTDLMAGEGKLEETYQFLTLTGWK